ncbi:MAG: oligosaccharide flippase family protein [Planctomycetaceae bacterium]|jgi:O-antigen/teichoic acid export membrane protein|nr:oligosaccharide flippase family protein [Planctomycetaceae bacterium]
MNLSTIAEQYCPSICRPVLNRVQQSPIGKRIASGIFWSVVGHGLGRGLTFVAMVLVARILGKETFGEFGLVRATASMFVIFSSFGMGLTATKYIAELLQSDKERVGRIIGLNYSLSFFLSLVITTIFYFSIPQLCETLLNAPDLVHEMRWGALLLFLLTFTSTQYSMMSGFQDFKGQANVILIVGVLTIPAYWIGANWSGLHGAVMALLFVTLVNVIINSIFIFYNIKTHKLRYYFFDAYKELPVLWKFSLPTVMCGTIMSGGIWICQMIQRLQPNGAGELGIYYALMVFYSIASFLPDIVNNVTLPMASETQGNQNVRQLRKIIFMQLGLNISVVLVILLPIIIFPRQIMSCFGNDFIVGNGVIFLFVVYCLLAVLAGTVYTAATGVGFVWLNFITIIFGTTVMLSVAYWSISRWGSFGLFLAMLLDVLVRIIVFVICILFFSRQILMKKQKKL